MKAKKEKLILDLEEVTAAVDKLDSYNDINQIANYHKITSGLAADLNEAANKVSLYMYKTLAVEVTFSARL